VNNTIDCLVEALRRLAEGDPSIFSLRLLSNIDRPTPIESTVTDAWILSS
jgi:hypothetical protein